ncbi:MAG: tryptophan--tRNA ligase, partial [Pseudomonadota bacterium]
IAQRFNHHYGEILTLPEAVIDDATATLKGLDGRKMSKSYGNTIPLFEPPKRLRKLIMKIKTNSLEPGEPKDPDDSTLFDIYKAFASPSETEAMAAKFREGIAWGTAKQELFEYIDARIAPARAEYDRLIADPGHVEQVLADGAAKARSVATPLMTRIREAIGLRAL